MNLFSTVTSSKGMPTKMNLLETQIMPRADWFKNWSKNYNWHKKILHVYKFEFILMKLKLKCMWPVQKWKPVTCFREFLFLLYKRNKRFVTPAKPKYKT